MGSDNMATGLYRMSRVRFAKELLLRYGRLPLALCALLMVAGIVAAFFDLRFAVLALMVLFIVTPLVVALAYFSAALRPECFCNVRTHTLSVSPKGLRIDIPKEKKDPGESTDNEEIEEYPALTYEWSADKICDFSFGGSDALVGLRGKGVKGFLWIDLSACASDEAASAMIKAISNLKMGKPWE